MIHRAIQQRSFARLFAYTALFALLVSIAWLGRLEAKNSTRLAVDLQPSAPYYATFYYPWYQSPAVDGRWSYWPGNGNHPPATWFSHFLPDVDPATFDPAKELYSSFDPAVIYWQLQKMADARLEVAISSWHGQDDKTDRALRFMLTDIMQRADNPYPNLRWSIYYESEGFGDPSPAQIAADLDYIAAEYADQPAYFRIDGKPVIFVWADGGDGAGMAQRWHDANQQAATQFYVVLKLFSGYKTVQPQPDSWHQYAPASRVSAHPPASFAVSPGFWPDNGVVTPRLSRSLNEFRAAVTQMTAADATWKLVTTWNEWGEGTAVEPGDPARFNPVTGKEEFDPSAEPFQNGYIDILADLLPPLENGTGAGAVTPTPPGTTPGGTLPTPIFSFAAAGDHSATDNTTAMLGALKDASADFYLALGDMSYSKIEPESAWCDYVKGFVGADYPFEILVGNHEDRPGDNGFIDNFAACLPDRLNVTGLYAHRYYFDYPRETPAARFILIDPNIYRGDSRVDYCKHGETENCDWLTARIDEAQQAGLWVIVGMHKNCITVGEKSCEIGGDLLDLLVEKRVDLILQGHEHIYERSKQLALSAGCPSIVLKDYDPVCVVDEGSDGRYEAGAGPIIVIAGTAGVGLRSVHESDAEAGYFASWMGSDVTPSYGFVQYDVSACAIQANFVNAVGQFDDSFVILDSSNPKCAVATPTPSGTPDPTPSGTPEPTPSGTPSPTATPSASHTPAMYVHLPLIRR